MHPDDEIRAATPGRELSLGAAHLNPGRSSRVGAWDIPYRRLAPR